MSETGNSPILELPSPQAERPDLLVIAGEHSGDEHAARMVTELLKEKPGTQVAALGGRHLEAAGAQLLHDLAASSVVGVFEVLKSWDYFKRLFNEVMEWIRTHRPRAICLVDYPGFNLRLARQLYREGISVKGGGEVQLLYYISPQVWAWKARRRFDMARWLDSLGVIFPFEVEAFADTDLDVRFLGHPFLAEDFKNPLRHDPEAPVLLLPGSRKTASGRIFPILLDAFSLHHREHPQSRAVTLYPGEGLRNHLQELVPAGLPLEFLPAGEGTAASAVLTSSGTMSLTCALAGIPGAIAYRANPMTYLLGKSLVEVPFLGIANLLLGQPMYPEFIQHEAEPQRLAQELKTCMTKARLQRTVQHTQSLHECLSQPAEISPASWLAEVL